jgi:hypothetical protein
MDARTGMLQIKTEKNEHPSISWLRGIALCVALTSASLTSMFGTANASTGPSASVRIAMAGLACECLAPVEANPPAATDDVIRIDEDWELVITEPDAGLAAPQVQTVMSPFQNMEGFYICFLVNHRNNPEAAVGGLEVQFWYGDYQLGAQRMDQTVLDLANETITWTQRLMIKQNGWDDHYLCFRIVDGQSVSWGPFGGNEPLHMNLDTTQTSLAGYSSSFTVANSGVFYSSNRVARLVLKEVRAYDANETLLFIESTPVTVFDGSNDEDEAASEGGESVTPE